jgi:hypothetical protein
VAILVVAAFLSRLFCRGWFSVVLLFSSWLIAIPTSLPFDHSPFATRYSPFAAVLPVAIRYSLPFSLVGRFEG